MRIVFANNLICDCLVACDKDQLAPILLGNAPKRFPIENKSNTIPIVTAASVLAVGSVANNKLYEELKNDMPNIHLIGDAGKVGKVIDAIGQAIELAYAI